MRLNLVVFALESAVCAQLMLFAAFLLSSRRRNTVHYLLAALSVVLAAMIAGNLLIGVAGWHRLADAVLFLDLVAPALFYLYVRQVRRSNASLHRTDAAHALPAIVGIAGWEAGLLSTMDFYVIAVWSLYLGAAGAGFARHFQEYAPATLRRFIAALLAVLVATIVLRVVMAVQGNAGKAFLEGLPYVLVLAALFAATCQILFTSLRHPGLLTRPGSHVKYAQSNISTADLRKLEDSLAALLDESRPYLDPDFSLEDLSGLLGAPPRNVSQVVNTRFGMNVSAYLNQCRIRHAAILLATAPDKPIKVVMFESGFTSKSIFNREFQRCQGVSPTTFRRNAGALPSRETPPA
jgi:AraC-like DNA-binding protein